ALSSDLLGLDPSDLGGTASKASFARALTDRVMDLDASLALVDAMLASRSEIDPKVRDLLATGITLPEEIKPGETFAGFTISKKLGEGPRANVYLATKGGADHMLKVFRRASVRDRGALRRFVTHVRLASKIKNESLPASIDAGIDGGRGWASS